MPNYLIPLYVDRLGRARKNRTFPASYTATDRVVLKRGDTYTFAVQFLNDALEPFLLTPGSTVKIASKEVGKYDASTTVFAGTTSVTPGSASTPYYVEVNVNTVALDTLLAKDFNAVNDVPFVDLMFEITWSEAANKWNSTIDPIGVRIHNDVIRGDEGAPTSAPTPDDDWVAHGHVQSLTNPQKVQAKENIGVIDPTALFFAGSDPNSSYGKVRGISGARDTGVLIPTGEDYAASGIIWSTEGSNFPPGSGVWYCCIKSLGSHWDCQKFVDGVRDDLFSFNSVDDAEWPEDANWSGATVTRTEIVIPATFAGQELRSLIAWWQWDELLTLWIPRRTLLGKPITRDDADTAYFALGVDAIGLVTSTPFP